MSDDPTIPYRLKMAEEVIAAQAEQMRAMEKSYNSRIEDLSAKIQAVKDAEEARERKRLLWGVQALGAAVMALAGVLWTYRGVIFK